MCMHVRVHDMHRQQWRHAFHRPLCPGPCMRPRSKTGGEGIQHLPACRTRTKGSCDGECCRRGCLCCWTRGAHAGVCMAAWTTHFMASWQPQAGPCRSSSCATWAMQCTAPAGISRAWCALLKTHRYRLQLSCMHAACCGLVALADCSCKLNHADGTWKLTMLRWVSALTCVSAMLRLEFPDPISVCLAVCSMGGRAAL